MEPDGAHDGRRAYLAELSNDANRDHHRPEVVLSGLLASLAADLAPVPAELALSPARVGPAVAGVPIAPVPVGLATPELLGQAHEVLLDRGHRRRRGVFYTAAPIADGLVERALHRMRSARSTGPVMICDPAVGGGAFLLAAARALEARGLGRAEVVEQCLWGIDLDPLAVSVTEAALWLWSAGSGAPACCPHLARGDTLLCGMHAWADAPPGGFDVVVGNPPFQSQLGSGTARTQEEVCALRERMGRAVHGYVDTAALFLLVACEMAAPGGSVALIQPQSVLASRDAGAVREALRTHASLRELWVDDGSVFDAEVRVCAPVFEVGAHPGHGEVSRTVGEGFDPASSHRLDERSVGSGGSWAPLLADLIGVPTVDLDLGTESLGSMVSATAGFRDQYYGIVPFVHEASDPSIGGRLGARLVTSGLIDPARCAWGKRPTRFAGRSWRQPVVDLDGLSAVPALARWGRDRLEPKVVVATQTRVVEAAVDVDGDWWPSVPTIAVTPRQGCDIWSVACVVLAPPVSAWALTVFGGTALARDALKLAARQVGEIPLPADGDAWHEAVPLLQQAAAANSGADWLDALALYGATMCAAYSVGEDVLDWWLGRLPRWR